MNNYFKLKRGADLSALVREASEFALKEFIKEPIPENEIVKLKHFEMAFKKIKPSVSLRVIFCFYFSIFVRQFSLKFKFFLVLGL